MRKSFKRKRLEGISGGVNICKVVFVWKFGTLSTGSVFTCGMKCVFSDGIKVNPGLQDRI